MPTGFSFPFRKSEGKLPAPSSLEDDVLASMMRIINTRKGERVERPDVGSKVWDFVFEPDSAVSRSRIRDEVRRAISQQEPRVTVMSVTVKSGVAATFEIDVVYRMNGSLKTTTIEVSA